MSDFMPVYDMLRRLKAKGRASFHTPGHKGRAGLLGGLNSLVNDVTELPDTASLYDGGDAIEKAELMAAEAFGSNLTLFSAGGCTLCIQTMLSLAGREGGRVLFARNSHRSAVNAAALLGIDPLWAWPSGKNGQVTKEDIERVIQEHPDLGAVYVTSPDYYGNLADIPAIAGICRRYGVPLLADNAHGSHLGAFGLHPLLLGADMTADSAHKTLPVLTGGAMLHIGRAGESCPIDRSTAKASMALFGSTSPSFPVLASLDLARDWWQRAGVQAYRITAEAVESLANTAKRHGIGALSGIMRDPARLTLDTSALGVDGAAAAVYFRGHGCEPEYSDAHFVVFIVTPFNTPEELRRLDNAIKGLPGELRRGRFIGKKTHPPVYEYTGKHPVPALPPRDALLLPFEAVDAKEAAGRISARAVCPCPPGIAAVVPGEILEAETVEKLELCGFERLIVVKTR